MRHLLRPAAAVAAGLLLSTTLAGPAEAAPAARGAGWLERQLTDGLVHNDQYDIDDYGLTADVALALDAVGGHRTTEREIREALAPHIDSWTTGADFGSSDIYAGSVAKAVVLAQVTGGDPRDFGGVDLVQRLEDRVSDAAGQVGRIEDETAGTDFANTIGQAFAVRGLARAGSDRAVEARRFLLRQQCSQGYFRLTFADKQADDQTCDGGDRRSSSAPDTDATALALLNLMALPTQPRAVRRAIDNGTDWLVERQKRNGSFGGGTSTEGSNTNSTGLAAWALGEAGACRVAADAARWVKGLQVSGDVAGTPLAGERGGIAYDRRALTEAEESGIDEADRDQWRRATTQAAPGLAFLSVKKCRG